MLPLILQLHQARIGLVGRGPQALKRLRLIEAASPQEIVVFSDYPEPDFEAAAGARLARRWPTPREIGDLTVLFVADLEPEEARDFVDRARALRVLVNAEDIKPLCDFHVPAMVRRGDLLLTISTGGGSPRLARRLREALEALFGPAWEDRLEEIAAGREALRGQGAGFSEVNQATDTLLRERGWLPLCPLAPQTAPQTAPPTEPGAAPGAGPGDQKGGSAGDSGTVPSGGAPTKKAG